jgi:hypothetical protein
MCQMIPHGSASSHMELNLATTGFTRSLFVGFFAGHQDTHPKTELHDHSSQKIHQLLVFKFRAEIMNFPATRCIYQAINFHCERSQSLLFVEVQIVTKRREFPSLLLFHHKQVSDYPSI